MNDEMLKLFKQQVQTHAELSLAAYTSRMMQALNIKTTEGSAGRVEMVRRYTNTETHTRDLTDSSSRTQYSQTSTQSAYVGPYCEYYAENINDYEVLIQGKNVQAHAMDLARNAIGQLHYAFDRHFCKKALGEVLVGKASDQRELKNFPEENVIASTSKTNPLPHGLTMDKIIAARTLLNKNEAIQQNYLGKDPVLIIPAECRNDMFKDSRMVSRDYIGGNSLQSSDYPMIQGFKIVEFEGLPKKKVTISGQEYVITQCLALYPSAMQMVKWNIGKPKTQVEVDIDKHAQLSVYMELIQNYARVRDAHIVEIQVYLPGTTLDVPKLYKG